MLKFIPRLRFGRVLIRLASGWAAGNTDYAGADDFRSAGPNRARILDEPPWTEAPFH
jgi:hypothetical protein